MASEMNERVFIRGAAGLGSLAGYYLAQARKEENWYPYVVLGGLAGVLIGDLILRNTGPENPAKINPETDFKP